MAEAVGFVASVITIAGLAFHGSKQLYEVLDKYQNAPKTLSNLRTELDIVQQLLQSIEKSLANTRDEDLPEALQRCLQDFKPSLEGLKRSCDEFSEKLEKLTNRSTDSNMSKRDLFKLQFEEKSIEAFRYRLNSHKLSINIALGLIN
jgi:predicted  nucleic acid-binding Zn-ribbon protein